MNSNKNSILVNNNEKLKRLLIKADNSVLNELESTELFKISKAITSVFLIHNRNNYLNTLQRKGLDINDIVNDTIAEAFKRDSDGRFIRLNNFINSLDIHINDINSDNLFKAYYSFLIKISNAHISRIYAQLDPNGFKIQRNIKETISLIPQFIIRKSELGYFYRPRFSKNNSQEKTDIDIIGQEFLTRSVNGNSTRELLKILADILTEHFNYYEEIALNDIVKLFKIHYNVIEEREMEDEPVNVLSSFEQYEIEEFCEKVMIDVKQKTFTDYYLKGKLTQAQSVALINTIKDIISEWINFGENDLSFYEHFNHNLQLTRYEYDYYIKAKLEYLIKKAKQGLRAFFFVKE